MITIEQIQAEINSLSLEEYARLRDWFFESEETDKEINNVYDLFSSPYEKMIEALVKPNALKLFQKWNMNLYGSRQSLSTKRDGRDIEFDLLLESRDEMVVIEVRSILTVDDVRDFLKKMVKFLEIFPRFRNYQIYGGVAGVDIVEDADYYASRQGLFVLTAVGNGIAQIKNDLDFTPTDFGSGQKENAEILSTGV